MDQGRGRSFKGITDFLELISSSVIVSANSVFCDELSCCISWKITCLFSKMLSTFNIGIGLEYESKLTILIVNK